jgi:hypothetical protein
MASPTRLIGRLSGNLVPVIETVKALHVMVASVMADQTALRQTVSEDPELAKRYEEHLAKAISIAKPLIAEAIESYNAMIEGLEEPHGWKC